MVKLKSLLINLAIPLIVGGLSGFIIREAIKFYNQNVSKPSFSPPSILFPIVWTILYTLMGISSYIVFETDSKIRKKALTVYGIQLLINFIWPIIFFNFKMYLFAFIWLVLLCLFVLEMISLYFKIKPIAAYLQVPYMLWLIFAAVLNFNVFLLN